MVFNVLNRKNVFNFLLTLNFLAIAGIFYFSSRVEFPDANSYLYMAKGFKNGVFSSWYFLPVYSPETLRNWGYPFFVYLCQSVYDTPITVKLVQLLMQFATVILALKIIEHFNKEIIFRSLFLLLLLPNLQIAYYAGQVASETPSIFFIVLFYFCWFKLSDNWKKYIILGIISLIIFQLRPSYLLLPFCIVGYKLLFDRTNLKYSAVYLFLFIISLLPFAFWNKSAHGVFKVTPLEGGAGAANLGFWSFRLPDGYNPKFYWDATFSKDLTQPVFANDNERKQYQLEYEQEWFEMNKKLESFITKEDSIRLLFYRQKNYKLWEVMSSGYTNAREKLLTEYLVKDIKANPVYYLKTRLYTAARLWFTGINKREFEKATLMGKLKLLYPFLVTFVFIFCGLLFILFSFFRKWLSFKQFWPLLLIIIYYGLVHIPFVIQARYTVPVHIFILMLLSLTIGRLITAKEDIAEKIKA